MQGDQSSYWARANRRRISRRRLLAGGATAGVGAAALAAIGCGDDDDDDDTGGASGTAAASATSATGEPKRGGSIRYAATNPVHLDPTLNASFAAVAIHRETYNRLFRPVSGPGEDPGSLRLIPDLATAMPEQPDETTYIIKIREDVKWHNIAPVNGRQLTGEDVVYTFQRLLDPALPTPNRSLYDRVDKVELVDPFTVKVTTKEPYSPMLTYLAHYYSAWIIPREAVEQFGDLKGKVIGTGPFTLDKFEPNVEAVLKRNPEFHDKPYPYLDEARYQFIAESQPRLAALEAGNLDLGSVPAPDLKRLEGKLKAEGGGILRSLPPLYSGVIMMLKREPLSDLRVRQALAKLVDQQAMIDITLFGEGVFGGVGMPPLYSEWCLSQEELRELHKFDPEGAKALLAEAGFGDGFDTTIYFAPTYSAAGVPVGDLVELYVEQLRQIGVNAAVEGKEYAAHLQTWTSENFNLYLGPKTIGLGPDEFYYGGYVPGQARNFSKLDDAEVTRLAGQIRTTFDVDEQIDLSHQLMRKLAEIAPESPIPSPYAFVGYHGRVKDYSFSSDFGSPSFQWTWVDQA